MRTNDKTNSNYKWVMLFLIVVYYIPIGISINLPAVLMTTIIEDTQWTYGQVGQFFSVVSFLIGIGAFFNSPIMDRLGIKKNALVGLGLISIGTLIPFAAGSLYPLHYLGRFLLGLGFGISINIPFVIVSQWFSEKEQGVMQGVRSALGYIALSLPYYIILPIHGLVSDWRVTSGIIGIITVTGFLLWLVLAREIKADPQDQKSESQSDNIQREESGLKQAARNRTVWLVALGMLGNIWLLNTFSAFFPTYLEVEAGMEAASASAVTGLINIFGIVGSLAIGGIYTILKKGKLLTWPILLLAFIGAILALNFDGFIVSIGVAMVGFCIGGYSVSIALVVNEIPGCNVKMFGGAMSIILVMGYLPTFFIPNIFQAMIQSMSMGTAITLNCIMVIIGIGATAMIRTGGNTDTAAQTEMAE